MLQKKLLLKEGFKIRVNPPYHSFDKLSDGEVVKIYNFIGSIKNPSIYRLQRQHYLKPANSGIILVGEIDDKIIGCAILGKLTFGEPKRRRKYIDRNYSRLTKREKLRLKNRILWIKRIVVDKKFRKKGIGSILVKNIAKLSKKFLIPKPTLVEVITSIQYHNKSNRKLNFEDDFLLAAEYKTVGNPWSSKNKIWDNKIRKYVDKFVWKRYYIYQIT